MCYAEETLTDKKNNTLGVEIYDHEEPLQALAQHRGYRQDAQHPEYDSEFIINELPEAQSCPRGMSFDPWPTRTTSSCGAKSMGWGSTTGGTIRMSQHLRLPRAAKSAGLP